VGRVQLVTLLTLCANFPFLLVCGCGRPNLVVRLQMKVDVKVTQVWPIKSMLSFEVISTSNECRVRYNY